MDSLYQKLGDPLLGTNPSFLKFAKHMRMDLSSDKLQWVFVTLFGLIKMKYALINHDGEIKGRESIHFANKMAICRHLWTWHSFAFHSVNCVNQPVSESIHFHESCHSFDFFKECIVQCLIVFHLIKSILPIILSCCPMFKGNLEVYLYS